MAFVPVHEPADFVGEGHRYVMGRCFTYWQVDARANGTYLWGRPLEQDIAELERFWQLAEDPRFEGRAVFIDASQVEAVDALAFRRLLNYLLARRRRLDSSISSMTMIHGGGLVGVIAAGLLSVVRPSYAFSVVRFDEAASAFSRAGLGDVFPQLEQLKRALVDTPHIVRLVQHELQRSPRASSDELAEHLHLSTRTLQRRLGEAGTSLRALRRANVVRQAEELLASTTLDLDAIAAQLQLASASHLVAVFQRVHGMTPGAWRQEHRP